MMNQAISIPTLFRIVALFALSGLMLGCASIPTPQQRIAHAESIALEHGWAPLSLHAGRFNLVGFAPRVIEPTSTLTVYIEGDGFAWQSTTRPSDDPTPIYALALELALKHPQGAAVYLARPCQYVDAQKTACAREFWTDSRFSEGVIGSINLALDELKRRFSASELNLVGYSGGGAIAVLVTVRRNDVARLITVAGNLDHARWTAYHRLQPLRGSLNPADAASHLQNLPQVHFVGENDSVIPLELSEQWPHSLIGPDHRNLRVIPDFDHSCCWVERWGELLTDR